MSCNECYYRGAKHEKIEEVGASYASCDYILYTKETRGCDIKNCDKFIVKPRDRNANFGCGSCIHKVEDKCMVTNEEVWSYKPSCKKYFKRMEDLPQYG